MKKISFFILPGLLIFCGVAAQTGDTQAVGLLSTARKAIYNRSTIQDYFQNQQFEDAISYLSPLLQADSGDLQLLGYAGYAYFMNEQERAAADCYGRMLVLDSNNITALHYLVLLRSNADPGEAIGYAARLLRLQPNRQPWWRTMGELSMQRGHLDSALYYFNAADSMAPEDKRTIAGLSEVLIDMRQYGQADTLLDGGLALDSLNSSLLRLRVRSAYYGKDYAATVTPGERLVRIDDPSTQALSWLLLSYYELKQYPDCIRISQHMKSIGLELEATDYYESRAWARLKEYRNSDSLLRICLHSSISPTTEWYYDDLASNHEELHAYREAVASYDTAYYLFKDPKVLYASGRTCETELHDPARARRYYLRYLAVARPVSKEEKAAYLYVRKRWSGK